MIDKGVKGGGQVGVKDEVKGSCRGTPWEGKNAFSS
jgi:hypothetical protein